MSSYTIVIREIGARLLSPIRMAVQSGLRVDLTPIVARSVDVVRTSGPSGKVLYSVGAVLVLRVCYKIAQDQYCLTWGDLWSYVKSLGMRLFSTSSAMSHLHEDFRSSFAPATLRSIRGTNAHPTAAYVRKSADYGIQQWLMRLGLDEYPVSSSNRDSRPGMHFWMWGRDLAFEPSLRLVTAKTVFKMVDVDYHLDMREFLRKRRPIIMYTFIPPAAGGKTDDAVYWFKDDRLHYHVNGGGSYDHRIWDYSHDMVKVTSYTGCTVYRVDTREVGAGRAVVLLTPQRRIFWPFSLCVDLPELEYVQYTFDGVNMVRYVGDDGFSLSIAANGSSVCVNVSEQVYTAVKIRVDHSSKAAIADVETFLRACDVDNPHIAAPLLFQTLTLPIGKISQVRSKPAPSYMPLPREGLVVTEDVRPQGREVAPPLADQTAVVPSDNINTQLSALEGRVADQLNTKVPPQRYNKYAKEFIELAVPDNGIGTPYSQAYVYEKQDRPLQRGRNSKVWSWVSIFKRLRVNVFVKREAYSAPNDPRIISAVDTHHNLSLSRYTYAFKSAVLSKTNWYAPGKAPVEVERLLYSTCYGKTVTELDFSRFDGTISRWLRQHVEHAAYLRWVAAPYYPELKLLLEKELNVTMVTRSGLRQKTYGQRLSGSPLTTDANTLINAFISYAALRDRGVDQQQAYSGIGLFAGDDGVSRVDKDSLEEAAKHLGMKLKARIVPSGHLYFVGRVFVNPSNGNTNSIQDPDRTLRKLHISFAEPSVSDQQALVNKAFGYYTLDPDAPITSNWCRKVMQLYPYLTPTMDMDEMPYYLKWIVSGEYDTWSQADSINAISLCAKVLQVTAGDIIEWQSKIDAAEQLDDLRAIVRLPPLEPRVPHIPSEATVAPIAAHAPARTSRRRGRAPLDANTRTNVSPSNAGGPRSVRRSSDPTPTGTQEVAT